MDLKNDKTSPLWLSWRAALEGSPVKTYKVIFLATPWFLSILLSLPTQVLATPIEDVTGLRTFQIDRLFWQKNRNDEMLRILTKNMNPLEIFVHDGILEATKGELQESIGWIRKPLGSKIRQVGLPFHPTDPVFKRFRSAYPMQGSSNELYSSYVIQGEKSSILIVRFKHNGEVYDVLSDLETTKRIESVKVNIVQATKADLTVHVRILSKDPSVKGLYAFSLKDKQVLASRELVPTPTALETLRQARIEADQLSRDIKEFIFGQDTVVDRLVHHVFETLTNGMTKPKVLVAMGPSGVGKSYSAQLLAERVYKDRKFVFEISGNEYNAGTHSLDYMKLLGGAKGTNAGEDGSLIRWLKETEGRGVLIINEGDKMHSDIWKRLMEFLEKGRISDSAGKEVWGKEVIVVITSNRGAHRLFPTSVNNWNQMQIDERLKSVTQDELRSYYLNKDGLHDTAILPREIINRVDEFIAFGPLSEEAAKKIAHTTARDLISQFQQRFQVEIELDPKLIEHVALVEFKASDDARQIRNQVKSLISEVTMKALETLPLEEFEKVRVTLAKSKTSMVAKIQYKNQSLELPVKNLPNANPLQNEFQRNQLLELESKLKSQIYGQDTNLQRIVEALVAYEITPNKERPFTLGLFGPSGTGKTEIGKTIAKALYGDQAKATVIPMGNVATLSDFETLFGSAAKYQGGEIEREFEKALRENPKGGVIILDEISNMGGNEPKLKDALFKKLYDIFEEGKYVSPRDNRTYDLKNYKFILSGNDGEKLFLGMTADDMLLSTWKQENRPENVRAILRESHLPNAFINRVNLLLLMKPLLKDEVRQVAQKLLQVQLRSLMDANPGLNITLSHDFLNKLTHAFFSADQGGRSVRKALETGITGALGISLLKSGVFTDGRSKVTLHLDLFDNHTNKAYLPKFHPEREVLLVTEVFENQKSQWRESFNLTEVAEKQILLSAYEAKRTAFHEAGHAVANDPDQTKMRVTYITIRGGSTGTLNYYGYARYTPVGNEGGNIDRSQTLARIASLWAGRKAQELAGFSADAGWGDDLRKIRQLAASYLTTWGLDRDFISLPVDKDGKPLIEGELAERFIKKQDALITEGEALAEKRLKERWRFVRAITAELLWKGNISQDRYDEIERNLTQNKNVVRASESYEQYTTRRPVMFCSKLYN